MWKFPTLALRNPLEEADAALVPSGNGFERVRFAAKLYHKKIVKKIVVIGINGSRPAPELAKYALKNGVFVEDIIQETRSLNTKEDALYSLDIVLNAGWKKIILTSSPHHQRRVYLSFKKHWGGYAKNIKIINQPSSPYSWFDKIESSTNKNKHYRRFWYFFSEWYRIIKYRLKGDL